MQTIFATQAESCLVLEAEVSEGMIPQVAFLTWKKTTAPLKRHEASFAVQMLAREERR